MNLLGVFHWEKKKKNFEQPNNQKPKTKKLNKSHFQGFANSQYFLWKFYGSVLGLVELIDAKGIEVAQPIWSWGCPT